MEYISSKTNDKIKNIISLLNNKKQREKQGLFVLEGIKILNEARKNKIDIITILLTKKFLESNQYQINDFLNLNLIIITEEIAKKISNNVTPQQIFGVCKIPKKIDLETFFNLENNILMTLSLQDTGNFGSIIRTADGLGFNNILLSNDCPDVYSDKVLRSSMGSVFNVKFIKINDPIDIIKKLKNHGFELYASALMNNSKNLLDVSFSKKNVIIVGNEGSGLTQDIIKQCDHIIKIPMLNGADSLNVSVATGILLWELKKYIIKGKRYDI